MEHLGRDITHHSFSVISVRETNTNGLVNEKYVCVRIPGFWMESGVVAL